MKTTEVEKFVGLLRETAAPQVKGHMKCLVDPETGEKLYPESAIQAQGQEGVYAYCAMGLPTEFLLGLDAEAYNLAPRALMEWLGFDMSKVDDTRTEFNPVIDIGYYDYSDGEVVTALDCSVDFSIAELNDSGGLTFSQIADLVDHFGFAETGF